MALELYSTSHRARVPFVPADPKRVTMYVCGPTVYNFAHIGNARPNVVFDVLARLLRRSYGLVYVRNITDVDDKINAAAKAEGIPIGTLTRRYADAFHAELAALGVGPADLEPRVTDHIAPIIDFIARLVAAQNAYLAEGHVLFAVGSYAAYGALSRRSRDEVSTTTGTLRVRASDFMRCRTSRPSMRGSLRSSSTTRGGRSPARSA